VVVVTVVVCAQVQWEWRADQLQDESTVWFFPRSREKV
jgi:hypothetical protein